MKSLMTEKQLQRQICDALNYAGAICWVTNAGMTKTSYRLKRGRQRGQLKEYVIRFGPAGMSDIIGCYKGRFLAVEVKLPETRDNVTELQKNFLYNIRDAGGLAGVATKVEEALAILVGANL